MTGINYVPHNVRAVVFRNLGTTTTALSDAIKDLIENKAHTISGLAIAFTIDGSTGAQGRDTVAPQMVFTEMDGRAVQAVFEEWAGVLTTNGIGTDSTIDVMFIESDVDGIVVVDAWCCSSMYLARFSGSDGFRSRDYTPDESGESSTDVNAEFACVATRGLDVLSQAQALLDDINSTPE